MRPYILSGQWIWDKDAYNTFLKRFEYVVVKSKVVKGRIHDGKSE